MKVKHNKYKNTGILFELLVRKITSDAMNNSNSKAASLVKYFFTSEAALELPLDKVSAVIFLTNSSNRIPVFLYLLCFIFISSALLIINIKVIQLLRESGLHLGVFHLQKEILFV